MNLRYLLLLIFIMIICVYGNKNFRNEKIISAQHVMRESTNPILKKLDIHHHGIKVTTDKRHTYLLHNMPSTGTVATNAEMSSKWQVKENINVRQDVTVGQALKSGSGITNIGPINYVTGKTCIGSTNTMKNFLSK